MYASAIITGTIILQPHTILLYNDTTTNMLEEEQRPSTFEEAFRDVQPRPGLEATLMARHPELQVEAERVRRARQEVNKLTSPVGRHIRVVEMVMLLFWFWM